MINFVPDRKAMINYLIDVLKKGIVLQNELFYRTI